MYSFLSQHPDVAKATVEARIRSAPQHGVRRGARLIAAQTRRSRRSDRGA